MASPRVRHWLLSSVSILVQLDQCPRLLVDQVARLHRTNQKASGDCNYFIASPFDPIGTRSQGSQALDLYRTKLLVGGFRFVRLSPVVPL